MVFVRAGRASDPSPRALGAPATTGTPAAIDLRAMRGERWILPPLGSTCHEHVQRACGVAGFVPDVAAQCTEYHGTLALVRAGLGVALVPAVAIDERERDGLCVLPTEPALRRFVALRVPAGRTSSSRAFTRRVPDRRRGIARRPGQTTCADAFGNLHVTKPSVPVGWLGRALGNLHVTKLWGRRVGSIVPSGIST